MLSVFSVREGSFINDVKFQEMCPALIQQLETESCKETKEKLSKEDKDSGSDWKRKYLLFFKYLCQLLYILPLITMNLVHSN